MASTSDNQFECCFKNWLAQQHEDLGEILQTLSSCPKDDKKLNTLIENSTKHFEDYAEKRALLAPHDGSSYLSPPWCTTFENSFLWIGGCRPSLCIRLVYSLCELDTEAKVVEYLQGKRKGGLADISAVQLNLISDLQVKTVKEEDKLASQMASLQEDIADEPLVKIAKHSDKIGEASQDVDNAMDAHALTLSTMIIAADKLRLGTLKNLLHILTPSQAIDLLVSGKKLHLSIHEWSKKRDEALGTI